MWRLEPVLGRVHQPVIVSIDHVATRQHRSRPCSKLANVAYCNGEYLTTETHRELDLLKQLSDASVNKARIDIGLM